jgi:hypothetical protein
MAYGFSCSSAMALGVASIAPKPRDRVKSAKAGFDSVGVFMCLDPS